MLVCFTENGWADYNSRQQEDKKTVKKINELLKDIDRNKYSGLGKPEPLSGDLSGFLSRRINDKDRLVYKVENNEIKVISCRYHYSEK